MGKNLKGKELGLGISQREDGYYVGRYTNKYGRRVQKLFLKLQECRQWLADSAYRDEHSNMDFPEEMTVDSWFEYWISMKKRTVRPNTVRNYTERYHRNIKPIIGKKILGSVNTIQCQTVMNRMADEGYRTSTIYQARITLYNMLDYAYQNDVIKGNAYEYQYRFLLQTGLRTGELVGLKWSDIDMDRRTMTIRRSMEYRHSTKEWRIGEPKSKAGYRTIPLTEEAVEVLRQQKMKNNALKVMVMEWSEFVFFCRKGTSVKNIRSFQYWDHHEPLCAYNRRTKTKRNRPDCGCFESGLIFFALKNWYMIGTLTKIFEGRKIAVSKNWYINEMPKPTNPVKSRFTRKER